MSIVGKWQSTSVVYGVRIAKLPKKRFGERPANMVAVLHFISGHTLVEVMRRALVGAAIFFAFVGCEGQRSPAPKAATPVACTPTPGLYRVASDSRVTWQASKNERIPVFGQQAVAGALQLEPGAPVDAGSAAMTLTFDTVASTENQLRDERIAEIVFARSAVAFELSRVIATPVGSALPKPGEGLSLVLVGRLSVGGKQSVANVPLFLSSTADGSLRAMSSGPGVPLDMRKSLGLESPVAELEQLSGAKIADVVNVMFDLVLVPSCV